MTERYHGALQVELVCCTVKSIKLKGSETIWSNLEEHLKQFVIIHKWTVCKLHAISSAGMTDLAVTIGVQSTPMAAHMTG